jgi:hypothetical protein
MIEIKFKCKCMVEESTVNVRYRYLSEDVAHWMKRVVQPALTYAHTEVSPRCKNTEMEYAKIPLGGAHGIGTKLRPEATET